jgi:hypothetical protein
MIFRISRFSYLSDEFDKQISASEIEQILNDSEHNRQGYTKDSAKWNVKKISDKEFRALLAREGKI